MLKWTIKFRKSVQEKSGHINNVLIILHPIKWYLSDGIYFNGVWPVSYTCIQSYSCLPATPASCCRSSTVHHHRDTRRRDRSATGATLRMASVLHQTIRNSSKLSRRKTRWSVPLPSILIFFRRWQQQLAKTCLKRLIGRRDILKKNCRQKIWCNCLEKNYFLSLVTCAFLYIWLATDYQLISLLICHRYILFRRSSSYDSVFKWSSFIFRLIFCW